MSAWSKARRARGHRGGALVEAALILPLMMLLFVGIAEYGLAWRQKVAVSSALGAAAMDSARNAGQRNTDLLALQQIRDTFSSTVLSRDVRWVMVYKTSDTAGAPPAACLTAAASLTSGSTGVTDTCNIYAGSSIGGYTSASFSGADCTNAPDRWFCPTTRRTVVGSSERIGVAVNYLQRWAIGMLPGSGLTVNDRSVAIIPPVAATP